MKKLICCLLCLFLFVIPVLSGCSNKGDYAPAEDRNYSYDYKLEAEAEKAQAESGDNASAIYGSKTTTDNPGFVITDASVQNQKLIYTCIMSMETLEFEKALTNIKALIKTHNGFIESEKLTDNASGWYKENYVKKSGSVIAALTIRIPTANYDSFLSGISGEGKVTTMSQNVSNITKTYYETETTIKELEKQEERLLEMMEKAANIEEMITVEKRLTEVQIELGKYKSSLSTMDTDVAYSTITLTLNEVFEYSPDITPVKTSTFWDRLKNELKYSWENFTEFLENLLFFLIDAVPILIIIGGIVFVIVFVVIKTVKKHKAKKNN